MIHSNRRFTVASAESPEDLAEKLTERSWCLCQGFRIGGLLFLNDSFDENGAAEFAVVDEGRGLQVESITFSWMNAQKATESIKGLLASKAEGKLSNYGRCSPCLAHLMPCRLCA